jgi:hypothetical protein
MVRLFLLIVTTCVRSDHSNISSPPFLMLSFSPALSSRSIPLSLSQNTTPTPIIALSYPIPPSRHSPSLRLFTLLNLIRLLWLSIMICFLLTTESPLSLLDDLLPQHISVTIIFVSSLSRFRSCDIMIRSFCGESIVHDILNNVEALCRHRSITACVDASQTTCPLSSIFPPIPVFARPG